MRQQSDIGRGRTQAVLVYPEVTHLLDKGKVQVVWTANAQVDNVHLCGDGIVERIKEPGCEGYLQCTIWQSFCKGGCKSV